jgi:hypothetical protein
LALAAQAELVIIRLAVVVESLRLDLLSFMQTQMPLMDTQCRLRMVFITPKETPQQTFLLKVLEPLQPFQTLVILDYFLSAAGVVAGFLAALLTLVLILDRLVLVAVLVVIQRLEQRTRLDSQVESDTVLRAST